MLEGDNEINYNVTNDNGVVRTTISTVLPADSKEEYEAIMDTISAHPEVVRFNLANVDSKFTEPAYKAALRNVFHLTIDINGMSEAEIAHQIEQQLLQQGAEPSHIQVTINDDGSMEFAFEFLSTSDDGEEQYEIHLQMNGDGPGEIDLELGGDLPIEEGEMMIIEREIIEGPDGGSNVQMLKIDNEDLDGLSVDEAKELILKKFKEAGIDAPENMIIDFKDDNLKIEIDEEK